MLRLLAAIAPLKDSSMMPAASSCPVTSAMRSPFSTAGIRRLALLSLLVGLAGCGSGGDRAAAPNTEQTAAAMGTGSPLSKKGPNPQGALLENIRHSLDLNRLGVSTDLSFIVSLLNQWQQGTGTKVEPIKLPEHIAKLLGPERVEMLNAPQFSSMDGLYLQDCIAARAVVGYAAGNAKSDLVRAVNLFEYTVRSLRSTPNHLGWIPVPEKVNLNEIEPPLTCYQSLLFGFGNAQDRAWLFSNLLHQFGIDSIILQPQTSVPQLSPTVNTEMFLMGVLIGKEVYLFDPHLGIPLPALASATANRDAPAVATLADVLAHPEILNQLNPIPNINYPITAEQLKTPRIHLIGVLARWSPRMRHLQPQFTGDHALEIADAIEDRPNRPGLLSRVLAAGGGRWNPSAVYYWFYPQAHMRGALKTTETQQKVVMQLGTALQAPIPISINEEKKEIKMEKPLMLQQQARLAQISGDVNSALKLYSDVRLQSRIDPRLNLPQEVAITFVRSDDDAFYFTGTTQFDTGDYAAAQETFEKYLDVFNRTRTQLEQALAQQAQGAGKSQIDPNVMQQARQNLASRFFWVNSARYQLALCQARLGNTAAAARTLQAIPITNVQFAGYLWQIRQWDKKLGEEIQKELQTKFDALRAKQAPASGSFADPIMKSTAPPTPPKAGAPGVTNPAPQPPAANPTAPVKATPPGPANSSPAVNPAPAVPAKPAPSPATSASPPATGSPAPPTPAVGKPASTASPPNTPANSAAPSSKPAAEAPAKSSSKS